MLVQFTFLLISTLVHSVVCKVPDSDETKFIDLLPENEKKQFLERVARRIIQEVKSKPNNQQPGEIDDRQLDVHSKYVAQVLKEEKELQEKERKKRQEANSRKQSDKKDNKSAEKIPDKVSGDREDAVQNIDLTLRGSDKNETTQSTQHPKAEEINKTVNDTEEKDISVEITIDDKSAEKPVQIPVQVIYDDPPVNKNILKSKSDIHFDETRRDDIMDLFTSDAPIENEATVVDDFSPEILSEYESCGDDVSHSYQTRTTTPRTKTTPLTTTTTVTTTELDTRTKPYLEPIEVLRRFGSKESNGNLNEKLDKTVIVNDKKAPDDVKKPLEINEVPVSVNKEEIVEDNEQEKEAKISLQTEVLDDKKKEYEGSLDDKKSVEFPYLEVKNNTVKDPAKDVVKLTAANNTSNIKEENLIELNETTIAPSTKTVELNNTKPVETTVETTELKVNETDKPEDRTEKPKAEVTELKHEEVVFESADITWKPTLTTIKPTFYIETTKSNFISIESVEMPKPRRPQTKEPSPTRTIIVDTKPVTFKPIGNIAEAIVSRSSYSLGNYLNSLQVEEGDKHKPLSNGMIIKSSKDEVDSKIFQKVMKESGAKGYYVYEIPPGKDVFKSATKVKKLKQPEVARSGPNIENPYYVPVHSYDPENAFFNPHNRFGPNFDDREEHVNLEEDSGGYSLENRDSFDDKDALRGGFSFDDNEYENDEDGDDSFGLINVLQNSNPKRHQLYDLRQVDEELLREILFDEWMNREKQKLLRYNDFWDTHKNNNYNYHKDIKKKNKKKQKEKQLHDYLKNEKSSVDWMWDYAQKDRNKTKHKKKNKKKKGSILNTMIVAGKKAIKIKPIPIPLPIPIPIHPKPKQETLQQTVSTPAPIPVLDSTEDTKPVDIDVKPVDKPYYHRIPYDAYEDRGLRLADLLMRSNSAKKGTEWDLVKELTEMVHSKDVLPILKEALSVPKLEVEPYVKVTRDMINGNSKGLVSYDWLSTTVDIQSATKKLKDLTELISDGVKINEQDMELYKYVTYVFNKAKFQADTGVSAFGFRKSSPYTESQTALLEVLANLKENFVDLDVQMASFEEFLDDLTLGVDDLHNAIKHIAMISTSKSRKWFKNLKDLYLNQPSRKRVLEVLLHLSATRLIDLWENSSRYGASRDYGVYMKNNEEEVYKAVMETNFVLEVLDEIKKLKKVHY